MAGAAAPEAGSVSGAAALLDAEPRRITIRSTSTDVQARLGRPGDSRAVVALTRADDADVDELSLRLASVGVTLVRLDVDRPANVDLAWDGARVTLALEGRDYEPAIVWRRLYAASALPTRELEPRAAQHAREQWAAWSSNLADLHGSVAVNPGAVLLDAPNRLAQLALAHAHGLATARCVATREPATVRLGSEAYVVKPIGPHYVEWPAGTAAPLQPRIVSAQELRRVGSQSAPVLVQEYVAHEHELRVYVVGDRVIPLAVSKPAIDANLNAPETIAVEPASLDAETAAQVRAVAAACRLHVAAVDLLVTPAGPVFLEINASPTWRWFELRLGHGPVSDAVADWLLTRLEEAR